MSRQHTRVRSGRGSSKQTPAAPTGLTATPTSETTIHLDWDTPYSGTVKTVALSGWKVYRSETSGSGFSLRSTVSVSEYDDTAVIGTRYYYKVTAVGLDAESAYSAEVSAVTQGDYQAPDWTIPDLVGVDAILPGVTKGGYVDLTSYYSSGDGTPVFSIQSITAAGGSDTSGITINSSTGRISVSETTPADSYAVTVDLVDPATLLGTVTNLAAQASSDTAIALTWTPVVDATGYEVEWLVGSTWTPLVTVTSGYYWHTNLTPQTPYSYRVRATDGTNVGPYSATVSAETRPTQVITPGTLPTFTVANAGTGAWTFGHLFAEGDVPTGQYVTATGSGLNAFQAEVRNRWPDGSVKFAVLSGIGGSTIQLGRSTTNTMGGAPVAEPGDFTVSLGFTGAVTDTVTLASAIETGQTAFSKTTPHRVRQFTAGPVMSEFHYYLPTNALSSDGVAGEVFVMAYVRAYVNGEREVEISVENGWGDITGGGEKQYKLAVTINGTLRDTVETDILNSAGYSTRQLKWSRWSQTYWNDAAKTQTTLRPTHNRTYMEGTRLVPKHGTQTFSAGSYRQSWRPFQFRKPADETYVADTPSSMGSTGWSGTLGVFSRWGSEYIATGNASAYIGTLANHYARGAWRVHLRDKATGLPATFDKFAENYYVNGVYSKAGALLYSVGTATAGTQYVAPAADTAHIPDPGLLSYWVTGRYWFYEELQFWALYTFLAVTSTNYWFGSPVGRLRLLEGGKQPRGVAWVHRTIAATALAAPDNDADGVQLRHAALLSYSADRYYQIFSVGSTYYSKQYQAARFNNNLGIIMWTEPLPASRPWMQDFCATQFAWIANCKVNHPTSETDRQTLQTRVENFRNHMFKGPVGRCGGTTPGEWHYTRAGRYGSDTSVGSDGILWCINQSGDKVASNFNPSYGDVWEVTRNHPTATVSAFPQGLTDALGQNLTATDRDYWMYVWEAIVEAADVGFPGAELAVQRVENAGNWSAFATSALRFPVRPEHSRSRRT